MTENYTTTADYVHIDAALKSFWQPFNDLLNEIDSFVPRPLSDFDGEKQKMFESYRKLNPTSSDDSLSRFIDNQIAAAAADDMQFYSRFSERFMTMYVTVAFLSLALCEAEINAILAMGLFEHGSAELFTIIEKSDIKEKWRVGPKIFCPSYELQPGTALFETLNHLTKQRNALMHHKVHLHVGDKKVIEGSKFERFSIQENARWMRRFFNLPYDLAAHAHVQIQKAFTLMLWNRLPIVMADAHKVPNPT